MDISKQYDKIGPEYIKKQKEFFSKKPDHSREFIKKLLPKLSDIKILDLGCGNGNDIIVYENLGAKEIYGIDSSEFMINQAKKKVKNTKNLFVAKIESMPFKDEFFNLVVGRFSIHYVKDLDKAYIEISRVLKKEGILILVVHNPFLGFMNLGGKDYNKEGLIKIKIYNNKIPLTFPHHKISDYFSKTFFQHFVLDFFEEEPTKDVEYPNKWNIPSFIAFKAIKRTN